MNRPLNIGINTLTTTARKAGVGEYISVLLDTLPALAPDWTFTVFTARDNRHGRALLEAFNFPFRK